MSMSELERFSSDLRTDSALYDSVESKNGDVAGMVEVARSKGYDFTQSEVEAHNDSHGQGLSDEALDSVAGGSIPTIHSIINPVVVAIVLPLRLYR